MKATNTGTSSQPPRAHQGDSNLKGAAKMKLTMQIEKAKQGLTNRIRNHTPAKLLGALVLGATLVTVSATILVAGQPEPSDPPSQMALGEAAQQEVGLLHAAVAAADLETFQPRVRGPVPIRRLRGLSAVLGWI